MCQDSSHSSDHLRKNYMPAIQLDTTYVVDSYSLTHRRSFSIVLPRESKFISVKNPDQRSGLLLLLPFILKKKRKKRKEPD